MHTRPREKSPASQSPVPDAAGSSHAGQRSLQSGGSLPQAGETHKDYLRSSPWRAILTYGAILAVLTAIESVCFWAQYRQTGFYLDDWLMLQKLTFGPHDYFNLISNYLLHDNRVVIRPVEALHFGSVFYFSGIDPIGWRLSNAVLEVISSFFAFLIVSRIGGSRLPGFLSAVFLLTYPIHDATHYWAVCSCVSLSLVFYLASLFCTICGAGSVRRSATEGVEGRSAARRNLALASPLICYTLSIFCYEPFLPLVALNIVAYVIMTSGWKNRMTAENARALKSAVVMSVPYALIVASLLVYQRTITIKYSQGALHPIHFDPGLMLRTIFDGVLITSPFCTAPFIAEQASNFVRFGASLNSLGRLAGAVALVVVGMLIARWSDSLTKGVRDRSLLLVALGLLTVVVSYSIFGLNPEYAPTLSTLVNRINAGAALGWSMIFAGIAGWFISKGARSFTITLCSTALLVLVFAMANFRLAIPWQNSWAVQKRTFEAIKERKEEFADVGSVLLINCPRYVNCSPVFDGTWDFQEMLRIATGRSDIKGGVVSERMQVSGGSIKDVSMNYVCGEYPFDNLVLVTPGSTRITRVCDAKQFITEVEENGTLFGLDRKAIERWKQSIGQ